MHAILKNRVYSIIFIYTVPAPIGQVVHVVVVKPVKFVGGQVREKWGRAYVWVGDIMPQLSLHNTLISVSINNNTIPSHYKSTSCDLRK